VSQEDCLNWLEEQKKIHPRKWFRVKDVQEGLAEKGLGNGTVRCVSRHLLILTQWGYIRMRGIGVWKHYKEFRAK